MFLPQPIQSKQAESKLHSDQCRVRIYLHFKETNHPKWQAVKHLFEDHDADPQFKPDQVDGEGAPATPPALVEVEPLPHLPPEEEMDSSDEAARVNLEAEPMEDEADMNDDTEPIESEPEDAMDDEDAMVSALVQAGVDHDQAKIAAHQMMALKKRPTFIEAYGKTITDYANAYRRNLNVKGLASLDLRTPKANGEQWDFRKASDRREARRLVRRLDPDWVIGAPPCTAFSIWNYGLNYKRMDAAKVQEKLEEGRLHLQFVTSLYREQLKRGKFFLHEQPATAMSWKEECIEKLMDDWPDLHLVTADQCSYGLVTPSSQGSGLLAPALKPTKFLTNSRLMAEQLSLRCSKDHDHQPLVGGRCKDAAMYPQGLVRAILRGITLQAEESRQTIESLEPMFAMPMHGPLAAKEGFGPPTHSQVP